MWFNLRWESLPGKSDHTWTLVKDIYKDVPEMTTKFLRTYFNRALEIKAASHLVISL